MRDRLQRTDSVSDEVIMGVLMLDMYENLLSFLTARRNKAPHMSGTVALIERRMKKPFTSKTSQKLILGTRSQIVGRALSNTEPVPQTLRSWSQMSGDMPTTPGFRLDGLNIEVSNLQAIASQLTHNKEATEELAVRILDQAIELDQQLSTWTESLPSDWMPTRVSGLDYIPQSVCEAGLYQNYCDVYKSVFIASTFSEYYTSRIKLQTIILTCLKRLDHDESSTLMAASSLIIQDLADTVCASIPFHLGDRGTVGRIDDTNAHFPCGAGHAIPDGHHAISAAFGGFFIAPQLALLLSPCVDLRCGQKQWIGGQLSRVKRIYLIRSS